MQEIFLKYLKIDMECKNKFLNEYVKNKKKYAILFADKGDFDKNKISNFNTILKEFIELQKQIYKYTVKIIDDDNAENIFSVDIKDGNDEIDLSFICFPEKYDFTNKDSSLNKIFKECGILEYYQNNEDKTCSKIKKRLMFANATFEKQIEFIRVTFEKRVSFEGAIFLDNANFQESIFEKDIESIEEKLQGTLFEGVKFHKEAIFNESTFNDKAKFFRTKFKDYASFNKTKFYDFASFESTISKDLFYFHDVFIGELDLIGFHYEKANFLVLTNNEETNPTLTKNNFKNKDTARIIKAHFQKQNNITETNDYFVIEQEFYIDLLKKDNTSYSNKQINLISLYFNKYVSNYGTDWVRVLIVMFGFVFLASFVYSLFTNPVDIANIEKYRTTFDDTQQIILIFGFFHAFILYLFYHHKQYYYSFLWTVSYIIIFFISNNFQTINNDIITLVNPLNIFNLDIAIIENQPIIQKNINYFEKVALYGLVVKAIAITLIYQFIISFRNSTRRN